MDVQVVVGTHALIQDKVEYGRLALVVTDEQHRFGVKQRERLASKGEAPHTLVMSATPIPRTLAIIMYGDLDISIIDDEGHELDLKEIEQDEYKDEFNTNENEIDAPLITDDDVDDEDSSYESDEDDEFNDDFDFDEEMIEKDLMEGDE